MNYIRRKINFRSPSTPSSKSKNGSEGLDNKLDVNEEYREVFRSKSYIEISSRVEEQLMRRLSTERRPSMSPPPSSSSSPLLPFYAHLSDYVLEPSQETAMNTVKSSAKYKIFMDYYKTSLDACNLCEVVLRSVHKTRSHYKYIQRAIKLGNEEIQGLQNATIAKELASFASLSNPLSVICSEKFNDIHKRLSHLLTQLTSKHKEITRKIRPIRLCKRILGYGLVLSYGALAVVVLVLAVHSIVGLMGIPGMLMLCPLGLEWKRMKKGRERLNCSLHKRLCEQLDLAARGVYILINQLDTMGRMVARLDNEIEHKKAIAGMCVRSYKRNQEVPREVLRELEVDEDGFLEQLDELEKHVYFSVLGLNRSRRLVVQDTVAY